MKEHALVALLDDVGNLRGSDVETAPPSSIRKKALIDAGYRLLGTEGLEGLTVRAVLKEAGCNRRSFYDHFSGKDDLVLVVFEHSLTLLAETCRKQVAEIPEPLDRLYAIIRHIVLGETETGEGAEGLLRGAALCREHMRLAEARPRELQFALKPLLDLLTEQLAAGIAAGKVRDYPPERLAVLFYNLLSTTVHAELLVQATNGGDPAGRKRLSEEIWEFCRRAIVA